MARLTRLAALAALALLAACDAASMKPGPEADLTPPTTPQGLVAQAPTPNRVVTTWTPSTDAASGVGGYLVYRDGALVATTAVTTYQDEGLTPATAYQYTVKAFDQAVPPNTSAASAPAGVTTPALPDTTPPSAPQDVVAVAASHAKVNVTWSPSTDTGGAGLAGYELLRDGSVIATIGPAAVSYADLTVQPSTTYSYAVRAFDAATPANVSAPSIAAGVTTPAAPDLTAPTVPGDVLAHATSPTRILVTWTASTDAGGAGLDGYEVRRDGVLVATLGAGAVSYEDLSVLATTTYTYRLRAFDAALPRNVSADSAPASATTPAVPDTTPPTVPQTVVATATSHQRVVVTWTASTDAGAGLGGYEVRRDGLLKATLGPAATAYEDLTVAPQTSYAYVVRAFDLASPSNASADSLPANVTTPAAPDLTPPTVPANVTAVATSPTRVVVSWSASTDPSGISKYDVQRDGAVVGSVSAPAASYQDDTVVASTAYAYAVRAVDASPAANASAFSSPATGVTTPAAISPTGLDTRPSNTTCLAPARPTPSAGVDRTDAYPSLPGFTFPVKALQAPGDPSRWFVVEQGGKVWTFANAANASTRTLFADLTDRVVWGGELGLLGMAFHPQWPVVPDVFLYYTRGSPYRSYISRFRSANGGLSIDSSAAGEQPIMVVDQPDQNHKAGELAFGPDGYLYASLGDGGGSNDTYGNGQNLGSKLAKILRIDVTGTGAGYAVPADNPFAGPGVAQCPQGGRTSPPACPEIWAFGFRNPWRFSFDRATGDLWAGDVGEASWEEVDVVEKGQNYGWPVREGRHCGANYPSCPSPGGLLNGGLLTDPVTEYPHLTTDPYAVTGGYVYRGANIPALAGRYLFADYGAGDVYVHEPGVPGSITPLFHAGFAISAFAEDAAGELYLIDYGGGRLYRLDPIGLGVDTVPSDLALACPSAVNPDGPGSVLVPYALQAPFWSDGAVKQRWIAMPDGTQATVTATNDLDFPIGAVLVKQFKLGGKKIETRLLMRHTDGSWAGYSYEWNDAETAATKVVGGKEKAFPGQTWVYPSEQQCLQCHTAVAGRSLGLEIAQQNGLFTYPSTGRTANQLATLEHLGMVTLPQPPANLPAYPAPFGTGPLDQRARAYLHSNCSHCHQPGGPTPATMDLRYSTLLKDTKTCGLAPSIGDLGIANAKLVAPGSPSTSIVLERMRRLDSHRMPPIGRLVVDQQGVDLVTQWIQGLQACP